MANRLPPPARERLEQALAAGDAAAARRHHPALLRAADVEPRLLYRLAMLEARAGAPEGAVRLLEAARARAPRDPDLLANLGQLRLGLGDPGGAVDAFDALPEAARAHPAVARLRGDALAALGRPEAASQAYRAGLERAPKDAALHANLGTALRNLGRLAEAARHLEAALEHGAPVEARVTLAGLLVDLDQSDRAIAVLREGLGSAPLSALLQRHLAAAARAEGDAAAAVAAARRAALLAPGDASAGALVAELADNRADLATAARWAGRARVLGPDHLAAAQVAARVARRRRRPEQCIAVAEAWLRRETAPARRYPLLFELAQALEGLGRPTEAYDAFAEANAAQRAGVHAGIDPGHAHRQIAALAALYRAGRPALPDPVADPGDGPVPLFLVGFPRSGTTLLDQVLDAHPDITVVEERPLVAGLIARLAVDGRSYPEALPDLGEAERLDLRRWCRARMARFLPTAPTRYAVDKMPLNLVHAGLIRSVFPEARFLLALRHPCDVVLSCFMQSFQLNNWMVSFTTLDGAAGLYRAALGAWEAYVAAFDPPRLTVRYEDVVDDLPREAARILEFLGLPWDDAVTRFDEHARSRGVLTTPSAAQVTQPIYRTALARWRRYDFVMNPVAQLLAEEIRRYGYQQEEDGR